jgi:hypothetical protein
MKRKSSAVVVIILIVVVIFVFAGVVWYWKAYSNPSLSQIPTTGVAAVPNITVTTSAIASTTVPTTPEKQTAQPLIVLTPSSTLPEPTIALMSLPAAQISVPMNDQLFYTNQNGVFSYDMITGQTWQVVTINGSSSLSNPFKISNGQRIDSNTIGFEVGLDGTRNATSSIYTLNLVSDTLTKIKDFSPGTEFIKISNILSSGEFVYDVPVNMNAGFNNNPTNIFFFANGTSTNIGERIDRSMNGSAVDISPDGKYIGFYDSLYNTASGTWTSSCGGGDDTVWLNNHVLVGQTEKDWDGGLGYCDISTRIGQQLGLVEDRAFGVFGDNIIYKLEGTHPSGGSYSRLPTNQIWQYNNNTGVAKMLIDNADFGWHAGYNFNNLGWFIYQPVTNTGQCPGDYAPCYDGVPTGTPMMFNLTTGTSSPFLFNVPSDTTSLF